MLQRALGGTAGPVDVEAVRGPKVADTRDFDRELTASELYERLRLASTAQLARAAGFHAPRQQLIAELVRRETGS